MACDGYSELRASKKLSYALLVELVMREYP